MSVTDALAIAGIGVPFITGIVMLIKAGPGWNQSIIKTTRDENAVLAKTVSDLRKELGEVYEQLYKAQEENSRLRRNRGQEDGGTG